MNTSTLVKIMLFSGLISLLFACGSQTTTNTNLTSNIPQLLERGEKIQLNKEWDFDEANGHNMNLEYASLYLDLLDNPDKALEYANKEYKKRPLNIDTNRMSAKIYQAKNNTEKVAMHTKAASVTNSAHPELEALKAALALR